eukprot:TRINITY_DN3008_c0_g1_i1.p1 TRINITY_DN3008_c0_g1~~TRINITY_DN3008_c0_g1_i1.p1  ORF type:complete len:148 (-),score=19.35 TRINITY_DN3008_c0_g1_i1:109-552(-)
MCIRDRSTWDEEMGDVGRRRVREKEISKKRFSAVSPPDTWSCSLNGSFSLRTHNAREAIKDLLKLSECSAKKHNPGSSMKIDPPRSNDIILSSKYSNVPEYVPHKNASASVNKITHKIPRIYRNSLESCEYAPYVGKLSKSKKKYYF